MQLFGVAVTSWNCLTTLAVIIATYILYDWLKLLAWRRTYKLTGPWIFPFVGTAHTMFKQGHDIMKYGKNGVTAGTIGGIKTIFVGNIDLLKKIFVRDHIQFQNRYSPEFTQSRPMNRSLLSLRDEDWKRVRNVVTPTFSPSKIKLMTKEVNFCADLLVKSLLDKTGSAVEIGKHMGCYTVDAIAGTGFGLRLNSYANPDQPFVYHASKVFTQTLGSPRFLFALVFPNVALFLKRFMGVRFYFPLKSIEFFIGVIEQVMEERKNTDEADRCDMIGLLMAAQENEERGSTQTNKRLSHDELLAMGFLAFVAGYDTTALHLSYFAYAMSIHPDIQDKLIDEIDSMFTADDVDVKYEDLSELPYLDQVVCETLRMYPPIDLMNRMTSHDKDVEIDGHWFPRNTAIIYSIWQIHHELGLYEEPEKFKPERFSPEEKQKRDPFSFMAFGQGPRNCIGMRLALLESKIAIIHLLKKLKFVKHQETEEPPLELMKDTFVRPKRPIKVGIKLRAATE